jgi:hypothetical protein
MGQGSTSMLSRNTETVGKLVALLVLAGCSGSGGMGVPNVVFTTPASATQLSSDNPEIPGAPPPGAPMPATILTNPAPDPVRAPGPR